MIREITDEDISVLVQYGKFFWTKTPYVSTGMEYNPGAVAELLTMLRDDHYLRVYEKDGEIVGFIGYHIVPMVFNPNYTLASEIFFFVHPAHRGEIGKELFEQAEQDLHGVVDMMTVGEMRSSKDMEDWYKGRGFVLTERTFAKVLN